MLICAGFARNFRGKKNLMYGLVLLGIIEFLNTILKQDGDFGDQGKIDHTKECVKSLYGKNVGD